MVSRADSKESPRQSTQHHKVHQLDSGDESDESTASATSALSTSSSNQSDPDPELGDKVRARRINHGLKLFRCVRDPFAPLRYIGLDFSTYYRKLGYCSCIAGILMILFIPCYFILGGPFYLGNIYPWTFLPLIVIFLVAGCYCLLLVFVSSLGVRTMMDAVARTPKDSQRPRRVRKAYESLGDLQKDLSYMDSNSAYAMGLMLKRRETIIKESIQRGFNVGFLDTDSQSTLLAACIVTSRHPVKLNESLRLYLDDSGKTQICESDAVPKKKKSCTLDEIFRRSGGKEEVALAMKLSPKAKAHAIYLRWALGNSLEEGDDLPTLGWMAQGMRHLFDKVDELNAVRLLANLSVSDRQAALQAYDQMSGGPGAFHDHLQKAKISSQEFRTALVSLTQPQNRGVLGNFMASLQQALGGKSKDHTIRALCAHDGSEIPEPTKRDIHNLFGIESNGAAGSPTKGAAHQVTQRGWLSHIPIIGNKVEHAVEEVSDVVHSVGTSVVSTATHVYEDIKAVLEGPDPKVLVKMLMRDHTVKREDHVSDRFIGEVQECFNTDDTMGMVGLLMHMDDHQKAKLLQHYQLIKRRASGQHALSEEICKKNWGRMELILLRCLERQEWVWGRVIYEACSGGVTGLGTDEKSLTSAMILNWDRRTFLSESICLIYKWKKGKEMTLDKLIDSEIESSVFKMVLKGILK